MLGKLTLAAGLVAIAAAAIPLSASAAPAIPQTKLADAGALVQQAKYHGHHHHYRHHRPVFHHHGHHHHRPHVHYRVGPVVGGYCVAWRHECAARWGWGTRGFYRCLWRHGC